MNFKNIVLSGLCGLALTMHAQEIAPINQQLMNAIIACDNQTVKDVLNAGFDVNGVLDEGITPLTFAVMQMLSGNDPRQVIELLLRAGASSDTCVTLDEETYTVKELADVCVGIWEFAAQQCNDGIVELRNSNTDQSDEIGRLEEAHKSCIEMIEIARDVRDLLELR